MDTSSGTLRQYPPDSLSKPLLSIWWWRWMFDCDPSKSPINSAFQILTFSTRWLIVIRSIALVSSLGAQGSSLIVHHQYSLRNSFQWPYGLTHHDPPLDEAAHPNRKHSHSNSTSISYHKHILLIYGSFAYSYAFQKNCCGSLNGLWVSDQSSPTLPLHFLTRVCD